MALLDEFELSKFIRHDVAETWLATEKATGRKLLLHRFPINSGLRDRLLSMSPDDLIMLVQADTRDNFYIVVTHDVPALRHFREWIERGSTAAVQQGSESFDPSQTQRMARESIERGVSAGDDLTRAFGTSPLPKETKAEPDDFTRMFAPPGSPNEPKAPAAPPAPAQQAGP